MIKLTIPGEPQGKARARTGKGFAYTPEKTVLYENLIKSIFMSEGCKRFDGEGRPLEMNIKAYYKIPKSASKNVRQFMLDGHSRPTKKPDLSNVVKVVEDALNNVAYYDDVQIVKITAEKYYSDNPRVEIEIREAE